MCSMLCPLGLALLLNLNLYNGKYDLYLILLLTACTCAAGSDYSRTVLNGQSA